MSVVDFFDNCRFWGGKRNALLEKISFYSVVNYIVNWIANIVLPIYFLLTKKNKKYSLQGLYNKNRGDKKIIVSLTSFPLRLPKLWLVIECLFRQSIKPDRIVLYLTESQVNDINLLPKKLLSQRERGLDIVLCPEEIRSHTKYYYAMKEYADDIIITVDDDIFYRSDLIETHLKNYKLHPNAIIVNWAKEILPFTPMYREWPDVYKPMLANNFVLLGVGSVLYPPNSLYEDVFNVDVIKDLCLTADDIWLSCMALLKKTPIYFTGYKQGYLYVLIKNNTTLLSVNRERNQICVDDLNNYYEKKIGIRPFIDIV